MFNCVSSDLQNLKNRSCHFFSIHFHFLPFEYNFQVIEFVKHFSFIDLFICCVSSCTAVFYFIYLFIFFIWGVILDHVKVNKQSFWQIWHLIVDFEFSNVYPDFLLSNLALTWWNNCLAVYCSVCTIMQMMPYFDGHQQSGNCKIWLIPPPPPPPKMNQLCSVTIQLQESNSVTAH